MVVGVAVHTCRLHTRVFLALICCTDKQYIRDVVKQRTIAPHLIGLFQAEIAKHLFSVDMTAALQQTLERQKQNIRGISTM